MIFSSYFFSFLLGKTLHISLPTWAKAKMPVPHSNPEHSRIHLIFSAHHTVCARINLFLIILF